MNETAPQLKCSYDYSLFRQLEGNRGLTHKDKIIKSIKDVGYVPSPIICNEKMQVIDGQGRLEACKELDLPVYFIVIPGLGIEHCTRMNISMTNWSLHDFIESYAKQGNKNYINLLNLMQRHPAAGHRIVCCAANETAIGFDGDTIKLGKLKIDDTMVPVADKTLSWLDEFVFPYRGRLSGRFDHFCAALIFAYSHSSADRRRLASVVREYAYDFSPISSIKHAIEQIERFYNRNLRQNKVYLLVEYDQYLVKTNASYETRWGMNKKNKEIIRYE